MNIFSFHDFKKKKKKNMQVQDNLNNFDISTQELI